MNTGKRRWANSASAAALGLALAAAGLAAAAEPLPQELRAGFDLFKSRPRPSAAAASSICAGSEADARAKGAYFRKIESVSDPRARGIRGRAVLPQVAFDPSRNFSPTAADPAWWEGPLDHPSVYVGASAEGAEIDAGLTWDRVYDEQRRPTFTDNPDGCDHGQAEHRFVEPAKDGKPLAPNFAFRPFWRATDASRGIWAQPPVGDQFYYYPGQRVSLSLRVSANDELTLEIKPDAGAGPHFAASIAQRGFPVEGRERSFKRVNSIDQYRVDNGARRGNEGFDALPTRARATGGAWLEAKLLGPGGAEAALAGPACKVVIGAEPAACTAPVVLALKPTASGGETIDIVPPAP